MSGFAFLVTDSAAPPSRHWTLSSDLMWVLTVFLSGTLGKIFICGLMKSNQSPKCCRIVFSFMLLVCILVVFSRDNRNYFYILVFSFRMGRGVGYVVFIRG